MKKAYLLPLFCAVLFSCKSKEEIIAKKWQATDMESPMLMEQIAEQKRFIDTIGTSTSAEENEALYGVRNMDSMRGEMKAQMDQMMLDQQNMVKNAWLDFNKNGTVAVNFGTPTPDTVSWYIEEDTVLMLDEMKLKGTGSKIRMDIMTLEKDKLQLRFNENGFSNTVTFKPAQ